MHKTGHEIGRTHTADLHSQPPKTITQPIEAKPNMSTNAHYLPIVTDRKLQIFDLGNVLYRVDARRTMAEFEKLGMPHLEGVISNSHAAGGVFSLYCDGKVTTPDFIRQVREVCHIPEATDQQITDAWNAMLLGFDPAAIECVRNVRKAGYTVALLSNCNELHATMCREQYAAQLANANYPHDTFDNLFHAVFFSQEIGMSKPDPNTWLKVLNDMGFYAKDAAFYDDSQINVDAANALGIAGVVIG